MLEELKRVVVARERFQTVKGVRRATGLAQPAIRVRLQIARMLGRRALRVRPRGGPGDP